MLAFRKYGWLGLIAARSNLAYLGEVATRTLFLAVILYIFLQLWRVTYSETGSTTLGGLTLAQDERIDDREDRRVGAETEGQSQDQDRRKGGPLKNGAAGMTDFEAEGAHERVSLRGRQVRHPAPTPAMNRAGRERATAKSNGLHPIPEAGARR